jgi:putative transposase
MARKQFTEEQIIATLRQAEAGMPVGEVCRGMGVSKRREMRRLRDESRKLKTLVADLTLDKHILQEAARKKW